MAKRGVIDNPKTKRLARQLNVVPGVALGLLETIWHWVGEFRRDGALTLIDLEDALDSGGWLSMFKVEQIAEAMTNLERECVWLDVLQDGRFYVHDWHDHAEDSINNWLARAKKLFANGQRPSLKRLDKNERASIEAHYEQLETSLCAQDAHAERTASAIALAIALPKPETPLTPQGAGFEIPDFFKQPVIAEAMARYEVYRKQKKHKAWVPETWEQNARDWCKFPPEAIAAAVDKSISKGWQGIFPEETKKPNRDKTFEQRKAELMGGVG